MVVKRLIACCAVLVLAWPARAHKFDPVRSIRIQIRSGQIEALLSLAVPQGPLAQKLFAIPLGLVPGEQADEPAEKALGRKVDGAITSDWEAAACSVNLGGPISQHRPRSRIVKDVMGLLDRLSVQPPAHGQTPAAPAERRMA